jgi:hypothetical protein
MHEGLDMAGNTAASLPQGRQMRGGGMQGALQIVQRRHAGAGQRGGVIACGRLQRAHIQAPQI